MIFKYGSYAHPQNEVALNLSLQPVLSPRGIRMATDVIMDISGVIIAAGQTALKAAIESLEAAYANDFQDAGLYHDDGVTPSPHFLSSSHPDNMTGNRIVGRSFPTTDGAEYATQRSFSIRIQARFKNSFSNILEYRETVRRVGNTGKRHNWWEHPTGAPGYEVLNNQTLQRIVQSGYAVLLNDYLLPPDPILGDPYLHNDSVVVENVGPDRYAQGTIGKTTRWSYRYTVPTNTVVFPGVR